MFVVLSLQGDCVAILELWHNICHAEKISMLDTEYDHSSHRKA